MEDQYKYFLQLRSHGNLRREWEVYEEPDKNYIPTEEQVNWYTGAVKKYGKENVTWTTTRRTDTSKPYRKNWE